MLTNEVIIAEIKDDVVVNIATPVDPIKVEIEYPLINDGSDFFVRTQDQNSQALLDKFPDKVDAGGGQFVVPVGVINNVEVQFASPPSVVVDNFPADPASGANQLLTNTKLDTVITKLNGGLPNALINGLLGVQEANSTLIFAEVSQINDVQTDGTQRTKITDGTNNAAVKNTALSDPATDYGLVVRSIPSGTQAISNSSLTSIDSKLPTTSTSDPVHNTSGLPVRQIPKQIQCVKTTPGTEALYLVVSAAPCWLYSFFVLNESTTHTYYVTVYNQTTAPTGGAAASNRVLPGAHVDTSSAGDPFFFEREFAEPIYLSTGCVLALESGSNPANTTYGTAPGATLSACFLPA